MISLQTILHNIRQSELNAKRKPDSVRLLAVSKKQSADKIRELYLQGQKAFGENYLQEALEKQALLKDCDIEWHFIGHIQSNKTKEIAENFSWVQSVDRFKIAKRLNDQRPSDFPPLNICIEVNIDREKNKSGVMPEDLLALAKEIMPFENLRLRGLMIIPEKNNIKAFQEAAQLQTELAAYLEKFSSQNKKPCAIDTLSMGMSADFDAAIKAGSTMVRVGTALFGVRASEE